MDKLWIVRVSYETLVMAENENDAHSVAVNEAAGNDLESCSWDAQEMTQADMIPDGWDDGCEVWGRYDGIKLGAILKQCPSE